MNAYLLFCILGLGAGAVYAMLGLGLLLEHRCSGVVNFAHGATAMFTAYVYVVLRSSGTLVFPVVLIPHSVKLSSAPFGFAAAFSISLLYAAVLGALIYGLVFRPLRGASPVAKVVSSVGLLLILQTIAVINFGPDTRSSPAIVPNDPLTIGGVTFPRDRLILAAIAIAAAVALGATYKFTSFGVKTRAVAENEQSAALFGIAPDRIAFTNWIIATMLAGLAGILISPLANLDPTSYTLFVIPALTAAVLAKFTSFPQAALYGLLLGVMQSVLLELQTDYNWFPKQGVSDAAPFALLVVVLVIRGKRLPSRGAWIERALPPPSSGVIRWAVAGPAIAATCVAMAVLTGQYRAGLISSLLIGCLCLSIVVVTGFAGQTSLAQVAFAGIGGFTVAHIHHVPFPIPLLLGGLIAVPFGLLVGILALRVRGISLAVVTLSAAATIGGLVFENPTLSGGFNGLSTSGPAIGGLDLSIDGPPGSKYPSVWFGLVCVLVASLLGFGVAAIRRSRVGREMIAVRGSERAAAASGVAVDRTKLAAFVLSSFIAGIGGALLAYEQIQISADSYSIFATLGYLAIVYIAGVSRISGAYLAGLLFASSGLAIVLVDKFVTFGVYQPIVAGVGVIVTAALNPAGIAGHSIPTRKKPSLRDPGPRGIPSPVTAARGTS
jgi:branched-subunit amino acid ABC-type transport system permease component